MRAGLSLLLAGCAVQCDEPAEIELRPDAVAADPGIERVVVLVLDGIRIEESIGEGYSDACDQDTLKVMPGLRERLRLRGTAFTSASTLGITTTSPAHAVLISGRRHPFGNYPVTTDAGAYLPEYPSLFGLAERGAILSNGALVRPAYRSISVQDPGEASFDLKTEDADVLAGVRGALRAGSELVVANLHRADIEGHYGAPDGYCSGAKNLDDELASFFDWLDGQWALSQSTAVVMVADHGRHRRDEEEGWREHGDHCSGCRDIPLLIVGPGIKKGATSQTPATLEDVGQTVAWMLGGALPYSNGLVLSDALESPPQTQRAGDIRSMPVGDSVVSWSLMSDPEQPSVVSIDGVVVSNDRIAEAPRVASDGALDVVCWRAIEYPSEEDLIPWASRCLSRSPGTDWVEIESPPVNTWDYMEPAMMVSGDSLWMATIDNTHGRVISTAHMTLFQWEASLGWKVRNEWEVADFPTHPAMVPDRTNALVAWSSGLSDKGSRFDRGISLQRASRDGSLDGERLLDIAPIDSTVDGTHRIDAQRLERPAVWAVQDLIRVAFVGSSLTDDGSEANIWMTTSDDRGQSWSEPAPVSTTGQVLGHQAPVFTDDGALHWAQLSGEGAELCQEDEGTVSCAALESAYVQGLTATGDQVRVSLLVDGVWVSQGM